MLGADMKTTENSHTYTHGPMCSHRPPPSTQVPTCGHLITRFHVSLHRTE